MTILVMQLDPMAGGRGSAPSLDTSLYKARNITIDSEVGQRRPKRKPSSSPSTSPSSRASGNPLSPRRLKLQHKALLMFLACFALVGVHHQWSQHIGDNTFESNPPDPTGQGILFFAYGSETSTAEHYFEQVRVSARRIKLLNPSTNITVVTNPGIRPEVEGVFDVIVHVEEKHLYRGKQQSWGPKGLARQWFTRLEYISRSPYEVTLALDSQALCCGTSVEDILTEGGEEFDVAFAVQGPRMLGPHNWAILYRLNDRTRRLFDRWKSLQLAYARSGSDQLTLHMAAGSLALKGELNVGVLAQNAALATVIYNRTVADFPKTSTLIDPRPVHFIHYDAQSHEDAEATCGKLNREADRARVVVLPRPFPRSDNGHRLLNNYEMVYSEEELATTVSTARKDAAYFRGLDWENEFGKWGHVATPWRDHYPNCWRDLVMDVNEGLRHVYHNPRNILRDSHFAEEFGGDHLEWLEGERSTR
ncbi:unnamed protein product [Ectocarpus sp. 12 AP-2014]